jgi:chromosome segregation ATPase
VPEATEPEAAAPKAVTPGTAAPEAAEAASTAAPPTEEEELEVVLGRRLVPSPAEIPLSRLIAKSQQVLQELEAGMRREWEKLEAEDLRLSDWEHRLGDRMKSVSARYARERTELVLEREILQKQLQDVRVREAAAVRREAEALRRQIAAEERMQAAADREHIARELADQVRKASEAVEAQEAYVTALAAATARKEEQLATREAEEMARLQELQKREEAMEEELAAGAQRLQEHEAALWKREAKVEELLVERSASVDRIARWVGAVNPLLEALGANPIRVAEAPSLLGTALQVLDSTAAWLRDVEAGIQDLLEAEGREVARGTAEYVLTSFRSHDTATQLTPVLVGPLRTTAAAAREGVLEVADMVAARLRRRPEPEESGSTSGPPEQ